MSVTESIRQVFGHFHNLNLLALVEDLTNGHTVRLAWRSGTLLCPVAHGLPTGQQVRELSTLGQASDLGAGCDYAARHLGAQRCAVLGFVRTWDEAALGSTWLLHQLEELWQERLADAQAVQELLQAAPLLQEVT
jgi:hypothetical protein